MFYFIYFLKSIATLLITNSHYSNVWPSSSLAVGGLLGNVLFFAASGFLLYEIKGNFLKWFSKRLLRIYPALIIVTLLTVLLGFYKLASFDDAFKLFVFPTNYIFLVWFVILTAAFYVVSYLSKKIKNFTEYFLLGLTLGWVLTYIFAMDKTTYSVDDVSKPFILFLYFACMLVGGLFRKYYSRYEKLTVFNVIFLFVSIILYFGTKILFSKVSGVLFLQILNQFTIIAVVYFLFATFIGLEKKLKKAPSLIIKPIKHLSNITLYVYLVQFVIINKFQGLVFPLNFLVVTALIITVASVIYIIERLIVKGISLLKNKKKENCNEKNCN